MTPITKPITREVPALRYLNHTPRDYVAEISQDGVRLRRKGSPTWFAVVPWWLILEKSVAIQAHANALESAKTRVSRRRTG